MILLSDPAAARQEESDGGEETPETEETLKAIGAREVGKEDDAEDT
jgi:hypothetical protein